MERRLVAVSGVLWTCSILAPSAGVPASHLTSSQQRSSGASTAASPGNSRPRPAVITRGNGLQEDGGDTGSTVPMAPGQHAVSTLTSAITGPSESSPRQVRGNEDVCHVTGYQWAWTDIHETISTEMVLYFLPRQSFGGIWVFLYLNSATERWWISKENLCITSTTDWHELSLRAFADSTNPYRWSLWAQTDKCHVGRHYTRYPQRTYPFRRLSVKSYGSSCWRFRPVEAGPSNRTHDSTTVRNFLELTFPADEVLTTSPPPADGPHFQVYQAAIVVVTVVVLVVLVVAGVFIRRRMTSHTRAARLTRISATGETPGSRDLTPNLAPPTPNSSQAPSELAQVFPNLLISTYSTQAPTEMTPGYRVNVEPQSSQPSSSNGHIHEKLDVLRGFPESDIILVREAFASRLYRDSRN